MTRYAWCIIESVVCVHRLPQHFTSLWPLLNPALVDGAIITAKTRHNSASVLLIIITTLAVLERVVKRRWAASSHWRRSATLCVHIIRKFLLGGKGWRLGVVNVAVLTCMSRATTKKGHQLFQEKSALSQRKSCLRLWTSISSTDHICHDHWDIIKVHIGHIHISHRSKKATPVLISVAAQVYVAIYILWICVLFSHCYYSLNYW